MGIQCQSFAHREYRRCIFVYLAMAKVACLDCARLKVTCAACVVRKLRRQRRRPAKIEFECMPYLTVTAMSAEGARAFIGGEFFKVQCVGQSTHPRDRFGARTYRLFRTANDWNEYLQNWKNEA